MGLISGDPQPARRGRGLSRKATSSTSATTTVRPVSTQRSATSSATVFLPAAIGPTMVTSIGTRQIVAR